jgi:hypothetical protein
MDIAAAAAVEVAAQLTWLKQLRLEGLAQLSDPARMQLTALTGLEVLEFVGGRWQSDSRLVHIGEQGENLGCHQPLG